MIQSGGFFGRLLDLLLKTGLPLIKNVIKPLAKSALLPLGLTAAASAVDAGDSSSSALPHYPSSSASHNNIIISNDEMKDIIKIVKSLEDSGLLFKGVSEIIQNEANEQRGGFLNMLLGILGASLLGDILTVRRINRAGEGIVTAGYGNKIQDHKNKMDFQCRLIF